MKENERAGTSVPDTLHPIISIYTPITITQRLLERQEGLDGSWDLSSVNTYVCTKLRRK
jgi:hypothetical protein